MTRRKVFDMIQISNRSDFISTAFYGMIELLTIVPLFFLSGFVVFRMLRVVRIFHLFRINASVDSFNVTVQVLKEKKNQILSSVFIAGVLMLAASLCMYSAEHAAQPEAFRNAFDGLWWSVSALLTVGYGDIYPITITGKIMAIVISLLGARAVAISAGFVEQYTKAQETGKESVTADLYIDIDSAWLGMRVQEVKEKTGQ